MNKSLIALATLAAFAGAASAQSSVTLYGRVDLSIGKNSGNAAKVLQNGSGSRFGVRGVEDLGGGMSGIFQIEHRYAADTGGFSDASRMWGGRSIVGLRGGFGQVLLGREYTTAFLMSQLAGDPWGWDTVVSGGSSIPVTGLGIARVRNDSSLTYNVSAGGLAFGAQIAEATDTINNFQNKPVNFAVSYTGGPLFAAFGYERTGFEAAATEKVMTGNLQYNFGSFKLGGLLGKGTTAANASHKSFNLYAVATMGQGEFRAAVGQLKRNGTAVNQSTALGYHYSLSKRTTIYADFVNNSKAATSKAGYDFGIKHNF
jgi:predicted porin